MAESKKKTTAKRTSRQPAKPKKIVESENAIKQPQDESIDKETAQVDETISNEPESKKIKQDNNKAGNIAQQNDTLIQGASSLTNNEEPISPKRAKKKSKSDTESISENDSNSKKQEQENPNNDALPETTAQTKTDDINRDVDITKAYVNNSRPVIELVAALSYILFFLPFIFCRKEPFALYHANQSLVFWILMIALYLIFGFIPSVNVVALPIIVIFHVLGIFYGMYNSAHGRARPFFLIGKITIIKWS